MTELTFAIVPDESRTPAAVFQELEDAITWALSRYGSDGFRIVSTTVLESHRDEERRNEAC